MALSKKRQQAVGEALKRANETRELSSSSSAQPAVSASNQVYTGKSNVSAALKRADEARGLTPEINAQNRALVKLAEERTAQRIAESQQAWNEQKRNKQLQDALKTNVQNRFNVMTGKAQSAPIARFKDPTMQQDYNRYQSAALKNVLDNVVEQNKFNAPVTKAREAAKDNPVAKLNRYNATHEPQYLENTKPQTLGEKLKNAQEGISYGVARESGYLPIVEAADEIIARITAGKNATPLQLEKAHSPSLRKALGRETAAAGTSPNAYRAGQLMGGIGTMVGLGEIAAPAVEAGRLSGTAATALTFGGKSAIQNVGNVATGRMSPIDYAGDIVASSASGYLGNAVAGEVAGSLGKIINRHPNLRTNPFIKVGMAGTVGMSHSLGRNAVNIATGRNVSPAQMAQDAVVDSIFGSLNFILRGGMAKAFNQGTTAGEAGIEEKWFKDVDDQDLAKVNRQLYKQYAPDNIRRATFASDAEYQAAWNRANETYAQISREYAWRKAQQAAGNYSSASKAKAAGDMRGYTAANEAFKENANALIEILGNNKDAADAVEALRAIVEIGVDADVTPSVSTTTPVVPSTEAPLPSTNEQLMNLAMESQQPPVEETNTEPITAAEQPEVPTEREIAVPEANVAEPVEAAEPAGTTIAEQIQAGAKELAANFGKTGQEAYVNIYNNGPANLIEFNAGFKALYDAARSGDEVALAQARQDPAVGKLTAVQQAVAVSAGVEDGRIDIRENNYGREGREGLPSTGSIRNVAQRSREPVSRIQEAAGRVGEIWPSENVADPEGKTLQIGREIQARELVSAASENQPVHLLDSDTESTSTAKAMVRAAGYKATLYAGKGGGMRVIDPDGTEHFARGSMNRATGEITVCANNPDASAHQIAGHEIAERAFYEGRINENDIYNKAKAKNAIAAEELDTLALEYFENTYPDTVVDAYYRAQFGELSEEASEAIDAMAKYQDARKELFCDISGGINQFVGDEWSPALASAMNNLISNVRPIINEALGGALDAKPASEYSTKLNGETNGEENQGGLLRGHPVSDRGRNTEVSGERGYVTQSRGKGQYAPGYNGPRVLSEDSEGRKIRPEIQKKIKSTAIVDSRGNPIVVYHGTGAVFDTFKHGDIGFHFGTVDQAKYRIGKKGFEKPVIVRAYLNIVNPAYVPKDNFNWHPSAAALMLWESGYFTEDEYKEVLALSSQGRGYDSPAAKYLRGLLKEKGYDGIVYDNGFEPEGKSYIAFSDDQIIRAENSPSTANSTRLETPTGDSTGRSLTTAKQVLKENGISVDTDAGVAHYDYSTKVSWKTPQQVDKAVNALMKANGVDEKTARRYVESEMSLTNLILRPENVAAMDFTADDRYTAIKKNSDYPQGTVDFNNNCRKRVPFTTLYDRLQQRNPDRVFTAEDLEIIRQEMIEHGYPVACAFCYVEERRQHIGEIADDFAQLYNNGGLLERFEGKKPYEKLKEALDRAKNDPYKPRVADLTTYEGLRKLAENHKGIADAFQIFNNARGMQSGRLVEGRAEYKREILSYTPAQVKRINDLGGLRIFSYSDFEAINLLDLVQVIQDASAVGLKIQAYTKVPAFARVVRHTGIKLNRSLISKGTGIKYVNGKPELDLDTVEGIDVNDPDFFDSTDDRDIGNIIIGMSDDQIHLAMESSFVDYIIPFHTSLPREILEKKNIAHWKNYKLFQNDKDISTGKNAAKNINIYTDVIDRARDEGHPITNRQEFQEMFFQVAKERNLIPRFAQFLKKDVHGNYLYTPGYEKFLIDFKLFDKNGNIIEQLPVRPEFDDAFNTKLMNDFANGVGYTAISEELYKDTVKALNEKSKGEKISYSTKLKKQKKITENAITTLKKEGYTPREVAAAVESGSDYSYSTRLTPTPKKTITAYKAFYAHDGKLYPPMVANDDTEVHNKGVKKVSGTLKGLETPVGVWIDADVGALALDESGKPLRNTKGRLAVKNDKGGGTLAFRPGWHLGLWPDAKQFNVKDPVTGELKACMPDGLVFARCSVAADNDYQLEALGYGMKKNGKFDRTQAGLPRIPKDGYYMYRTNVDPTTAPWIITGAIKVEEILDDDMAAEICAKYGITADPRASHKKINLADYGLKAGPVTPTEDMDRFLPNDAVKANAAALEAALADPDYADAYVAMPVNFDDPEIIKELARNKQNAAFYKDAQAKYGNKAYPVNNPNDPLLDQDTFAYSTKLALQDREKAPTFYSKLQREVEGFKGDKIGAASVESYLKGKGVKDEEIKWSGIRTFLEGKKSVDKQELMDYLQNNEMEIETKILSSDSSSGTRYTYEGDDGMDSFTREEAEQKAAEWVEDMGYDSYELRDTEYGLDMVFFEDGEEMETQSLSFDNDDGETRWAGYRLQSGKNYREILFKIPNSDYSNRMMDVHWGEKGVLAHARVQDFETDDGGKVLFVEEIQSDWHNEGQKKGYYDPNASQKARAALSNERNTLHTLEEETVSVLKDAGYDTPQEMYDSVVRMSQDVWDVMKQLLEEQVVESLEKARRAVARVRELTSDTHRAENATTPDAPFRDSYTNYALKNLLRMAAEGDYDYLAWTTGKMQENRWSSEYAEGYRIEYDQEIPGFLRKYGKQWQAGLQNIVLNDDNNSTVPAIVITDAMKESVLYEGQPMYSTKLNLKNLTPEEKERFAQYRKLLAERRRERKDISETRKKLLRKANEAVRKAKNRPGYASEAIQDLLKDLDLVAVGIRSDTKDKLTQKYFEILEMREKDPNYAALHSEKDMRKVERLFKKQIKDMDIDEVRDLITELTALTHYQETQNKLFRDSQNRDAAEAGRQWVKDLKAMKPLDVSNGVKQLSAKYLRNNLSPERAARMISGYKKGAIAEELVKNLEDGLTKQLAFEQKADAMFRPFLEDKNNADFVKNASKQTIQITDKDGTTAMISPAMRVSLYMHRKNNDNLNHIAAGGIVVPNEKLYEQGKIEDAYTRGRTLYLNPTDIDDIIKDMTPSEIAYADLLHDFFDGQAKNAINETSLTLDGIFKAVVDGYFPITSDENFLAKAMDLVKDPTLEGWGNLKSRQEGSINPILLEDATKVLQRHIKKTAQYAGLAIPLRDFQKVYGYVSSGYETSVQKAIGETWGVETKDYLTQWIEDLNAGGRQAERGVLEWMRSAYAGSVLTFNPSVALKQTTSYFMAGSILDTGSLMYGLSHRFTKADREYMDSITPWGWARRQGQSTIELGDLAKRRDFAAKLPNWNQIMDVFTTDRLFLATENAVQKEHPGLKRGDKAYDEALAEKYNQVLWRTQPQYDAMFRPEYLRKTDLGSRTFGMFKTESMQMSGELIDSFAQWRADSERAKDGKDETRKAKSESAKNFYRTFASWVASNMAFAVMGTALNVLLMHKAKNYRDEKGELEPKTLIEKTALNFLGSSAGGFFYGSTVYDLGQYIYNAAKGQKSTWYDIEAPGLSLINDAINNMGNLIGVLTNEESNREAITKAIAKFTLSASKFTPAGFAENIYNMANSIYLYIQDWREGVLGSYEAGVNLFGLKDTSPTKDQYANQVLDAFSKGNEKKGRRALEKTGRTQLEKALGAEAEKDEYGKTISGSKQQDALHKISQLDMDDKYKVEIIETMYPKLDGMQELLELGDVSLDEIIAVQDAKANGKQSGVSEYLKDADLTEESKQMLWELAAGYSSTTYEKNVGKAPTRTFVGLDYFGSGLSPIADEPYTIPVEPLILRPRGHERYLPNQRGEVRRGRALGLGSAMDDGTGESFATYFAAASQSSPAMRDVIISRYIDRKAKNGDIKMDEIFQMQNNHFPSDVVYAAFKKMPMRDQYSYIMENWPMELTAKYRDNYERQFETGDMRIPPAKELREFIDRYWHIMEPY